MGRMIVSVIVGYIVMFVIVFVSFSLAYLAMGADGAFRPGTYDITVIWALLSIVLSLIAAVAGGYICAAIAKNPRGPKALALIVLLLGILSALPAITGSYEGRPNVREAGVGNLEAAQNARQPVWIALLNPLIGVAGVMVGARLKGQRPATFAD